MSVQESIERLLRGGGSKESVFFRRGFDAAVSGVSIHDNPYKSPVDHMHGGRSIQEWNEEQWLKGWMAAAGESKERD